jgi:hypothetical protein
VKKALLQHLGLYHSKEFRISTIHSDGEGAIAAIKREIEDMGYEVDLRAPGQHDPYIERKIQTVKGTARAILSVLPFLLPIELFIWLMQYATYCTNLQPHKAGYLGLSPREAFTGRKLMLAMPPILTMARARCGDANTAW